MSQPAQSCTDYEFPKKGSLWKTIEYVYAKLFLLGRETYIPGENPKMYLRLISSVFCSFKSRLISEVFSRIPEGSEFVPSQG